MGWVRVEVGARAFAGCESADVAWNECRQPACLPDPALPFLPAIAPCSLALFSCTQCGSEEVSWNDRGKVNEPAKCPNPSCQAKFSMQMVYNRSCFLDKQLMKMQENPNEIPEGETPHTVSMFARQVGGCGCWGGSVAGPPACLCPDAAGKLPLHVWCTHCCRPAPNTTPCLPLPRPWLCPTCPSAGPG